MIYRHGPEPMNRFLATRWNTPVLPDPCAEELPRSTACHAKKSSSKGHIFTYFLSLIINFNGYGLF